MTYSVQNLTHELQDHVIALSKAGEFAGQQAARTVFAYYCHRVAANDEPGRGFMRLHVMPGSLAPRLVAHATGLYPKTVRTANVWLHEHGFIELAEATGGRYRYVTDVEILSVDTESEAARRVRLDVTKRPKVAARAAERKLAAVIPIGRHAQSIGSHAQ